jgi:hypothetical protein
MSRLTGNHTKHTNIMLQSAEGLEFTADVIKWLIKNSDSSTFTRKCATNFYDHKNIRNITLWPSKIRYIKMSDKNLWQTGNIWNIKSRWVQKAETCFCITPWTSNACYIHSTCTELHNKLNKHAVSITAISSNHAPCIYCNGNER